MIESDRLFQVIDWRAVTGHVEIVSQWWADHDMPGAFQHILIPKLAIFVLAAGAPVAFMAASMDNSIGKATIESAITAPGRTPAQTRAALQFGEGALFATLKENNYTFCLAFTSPAIARTLERSGWERAGENLVQLIKPIE